MKYTIGLPFSFGDKESNSSQVLKREKQKQSQWRSQEAQIDLVIDREDNCINLSEMKFYQGDFVMTKEEADKLEKRKRAFAKNMKTRKALFTTLITSYGVKQNPEYLRVVDQHLSLESLFRYELVGA